MLQNKTRDKEFPLRVETWDRYRSQVFHFKELKKQAVVYNVGYENLD